MHPCTPCTPGPVAPRLFLVLFSSSRSCCRRDTYPQLKRRDSASTSSNCLTPSVPDGCLEPETYSLIILSFWADPHPFAHVLSGPQPTGHSLPRKGNPHEGYAQPVVRRACTSFSFVLQQFKFDCGRTDGTDERMKPLIAGMVWGGCQLGARRHDGHDGHARGTRGNEGVGSTRQRPNRVAPARVSVTRKGALSTARVAAAAGVCRCCPGRDCCALLYPLHSILYIVVQMHGFCRHVCCPLDSCCPPRLAASARLPWRSSMEHGARRRRLWRPSELLLVLPFSPPRRRATTVRHSDSSMCT